MSQIDILNENIAELLTNTVNMASVFYDIFLNPEPMDVHLEMFDSNNQLITVTIPNRAKDRVTPYVGEGEPEGVVEAPIGSTYIDTTSSTVYYKISGNDASGWSAVLSQSLMELYVRTYLEAGGYLTTDYLNTYLNSNGYIKESDTATSGSYGVVKIDGDTIGLNSSNQINVKGITDSNTENPITRKLWIGAESDYRELFLSDSVRNDTIYILTDSGQLLVGKTQIAHNAFPANTSEAIPLGTSGSYYTAPADGWFLLSKYAGTANTYMKITNTVTGFAGDMNFTDASYQGTVTCPALKGETVIVEYTATGDPTVFKFINASSNNVTYSAS